MLTINRVLNLGWKEKKYNGEVFYKKGNLVLIAHFGKWSPGYYFDEPSILDQYINSEKELFELLDGNNNKWKV